MQNNMRTVISAISSALILASSVSCNKINKHEYTADDHSAQNQSRLRWMSTQMSMITADRTGITPDADYMAKTFIYNVASDASYGREGYKMDVDTGILTAGRLYHAGYIRDKHLTDPFDLSQFYVEHPDEQPRAYGIHPNAIDGRETYEEFCKWFAGRVKEVPAPPPSRKK